MPQNAKVVMQSDKDGPLEIRDVELPDPQPHQVAVRMLATGICQSQIFWMHQPREAPVLFGHEGYGIATQVGSEVEGVREGDHVMVTWLPRYDASGRKPEVATIELPDGQVARSPNVYTWATHVVADGLYVRSLAGKKHNEVVSVVGCAVITGAGSVLNSVKLEQDDTVAVWGAGGVGLSAIAAAKVAGASRIVAVDIIDEKLELARKFGATDLVNSRKMDPAKAIHELLPGGQCSCSGVDYAFDCVGFNETTTQAFDAARSGTIGRERGGTAVIVGIPKAKLELDTVAMMMQEKDLKGALAGSCKQEDIDMFLDWYQAGKLDLDLLITNRYSFNSIAEGVDALERGQVQGRAIAVF